MQIAMLSLTMTSMHTQIKQLETEFEKFKMDSKPTFDEINNAADTLSVDDSVSEGYDTDDSDEEDSKPSGPKQRGVSRYVMIPDYCEDMDSSKAVDSEDSSEAVDSEDSSKAVDSEDSGYESGYESEEIPRIRKSPILIPEDKGIDRVNLDLITEDWKARALLLEEI